MSKAVLFENLFSDLVAENLTKEDLEELEKYFGKVTLMEMIQEALEE